MIKSISLFFSLTALILIFISCSSTPFPEERSDCLLVYICSAGKSQEDYIKMTKFEKITFSGPSEFSLKPSSKEWTIKTIKLAPGTYTTDGLGSKSIIEEIIIEPGSIILFPLKFVQEEDETIYAAPITPEDQENSILALTDYIGFDRWYGRKYKGFGPFRPRMFLSKLDKYILTIDTTPGEAGIFIDNEEWGMSPKDIKLPWGKYLLEIKKDNYKPYKKFINLSSNREIDVALEDRKEKEIALEKEGFNIMVLPFITIDDESDTQYSSIFQDTFMVNFKKDERLNVIKPDTPDIDLSKSEYPDFNAAEEYGAELLVGGRYQLEGDEIIVHAVLHDVKSNRIKYADLYPGEAGFSIFSSIDNMSATYAEAVSNILPEPGEPIIEKEEDITEEIIAYERNIFREHVIEARCKSKNIISFETGIYGPNDMIDVDSSTKTGRFQFAFLPNSFKIKYERILFPELSFVSSIAAYLGNFYNVFSFSPPIIVDIFLFTGPQLNFRSEKTDLYLSPLAACGLSPSFDAVYHPPGEEESEGINISAGPFFFTGLMLDVGFKIYPSDRISAIPYFFNVGLLFNLFMFRSEGDLAFSFLDTLMGNLYFGIGVGI